MGQYRIHGSSQNDFETVVRVGQQISNENDKRKKCKHKQRAFLQSTVNSTHNEVLSAREKCRKKKIKTSLLCTANFHLRANRGSFVQHTNLCLTQAHIFTPESDKYHLIKIYTELGFNLCQLWPAVPSASRCCDMVLIRAHIRFIPLERGILHHSSLLQLTSTSRCFLETCGGWGQHVH